MRHFINRNLLSLTCLCIIFFSSGNAFSNETDQAWQAKYKDQPYLRLLNEVTIRLNKDYTYTKTWHQIDKIQNEAGKAQGEVDISYDEKREEIQNIEAYTVRPDGSRIKCDSILDQTDPHGFGIYSDQRKKVITAPEALVGNIIDVKITSIHKVPVIDGNFFDSFRISCTCPVKEARYRLILPAGMKLNMKAFNTDLKPRIERDGNNVIYTWETFDNSKDEIEESMPSGEEVFPIVVITSLDNWDQLAKWYWKLSRKNLQSSPELKSKVAEITSGKKTVSEKIQAIIEYIRKEFRYVSMNIDYHGYEPHPSDEIFKHRYGDCKDQTMLAIAMLSEIGVEARPVLMSTWAELRRKDLLPMPSYFNHAILSFDIDGITYYTDVLKKGYEFNELPIHLSGKNVFAIKPDGGKFITLPEADNIETANTSSSKVIISGEGKAIVEAKIVIARSLSVAIKEQFKNATAEEQAEFKAALKTKILSGGTLISESWENLENSRKQIIYKIKYEDPALVQRMGDFMTFGLERIQRSSRFTTPKRKLPIVSKSNAIVEDKIMYVMPKGYEIVSLPGKVALETSTAALVREYSSASDSITAHQVFSSKKGRMEAADYAQVQKFYEDVTRLTNDKVVIRKKQQ